MTKSTFTRLLTLIVSTHALGACLFFDGGNDNAQLAITDGQGATDAFYWTETRWLEAECACDWSAWGYASEQACRDDSALTPPVVSCLDETFDANLEAYRGWLACVDRVGSAAEACPDACGLAHDRCIEDLAIAYDACHAEASARDLDAVAGCFSVDEATPASTEPVSPDDVDDAIYNVNVAFVGLLVEHCQCAGATTDDEVEACVREVYAPIYDDACTRSALTMDPTSGYLTMVCVEQHIWSWTECQSMCPSDPSVCDDPMTECDVLTETQRQAFAACDA